MQIKVKKRKRIRLARLLFKNPNKKLVVNKITVTTPRKPNSARRKTVRGHYRLKITVQTYIPGGEHDLKKFSLIHIRGQGARDLPGIYTTAIRGRYDLEALKWKTKRRSIYGAKQHI